jgi:LPXTG-motif cell wall-anchored protein
VVALGSFALGNRAASRYAEDSFTSKGGGAMQKRSILFVAAVGVLGFASPAAAQVKCDSYPNVCVDAVTLQPETAAPVAIPVVAAKPVQVQGQQQLPVTGSDATAMAVAGLALVGTGVVMTRRSKSATSDLG